MAYKIKVYEDAHDEMATEVFRENTLDVAMELAVKVVRMLEREHDEFGFSSAGETELFEIFPKEGFGTVVVEEE